MGKSYKKSFELWEESKKYLVPGSSTITKDPRLFPFGAYPIYITSGKGALVCDVDGNEYIDFAGSLGANILGYAYEPVVRAVHAQLERGALFSLLSPLAISVAKKICDLVPCAERVRLVTSSRQ